MLKSVVKRIYISGESLRVIGLTQVLTFAHNFDIAKDNRVIIAKNTELFLETELEVGLEVKKNIWKLMV